MLISVIIFWVSLSVLFYCYFGYGIILFLYNNLRSAIAGKKTMGKMAEPVSATLIVTAYNEASTLASKVHNTLAIDYPESRLDIIFVTDGSTDNSVSILKNYPRIKILHQAVRKGKMAAIKRAMKEVKTDMVVFSDANTDLNEQCISKMAAHYHDPETGGVAGEKKILDDRYPSAVGEAEGLYWRYESFLKNQDAHFNTVVGAAGELFSIRTKLFTFLDDGLILDDFMISMKVCLQGYRIAYEPGAFATELPSASLAEEAKRKVRISAGAYQCISELSSLLNIFRRPLLSFQYISRRLLRWVVCPLMLVALLVSNISLAVGGTENYFYSFFLFGQLFFYLMAISGWVLVAVGRRAGLFTIPFYFVFMNYCLVKGFVRFLKGKHTVLWEKSARQPAG
jgi:cellulose synthase/poly-beta-1,6-N-acetylglucosamine synthase-like glycosyltransferase